MKKQVFLTKVCKMIAANEVRGTVRELIAELAVNGNCRPVKQVSRSYSDKTCDILKVLKEIGLPECKMSKKGNYFNVGWYLTNDAPRGGKIGNIIKINFK